MTVGVVLVGSLVVLALAYAGYGRLLAGVFGLDDRASTPAVRREDGEDFIPTPPTYLLPQHFSAIAAAGPIAGPILACRDFGWVPCLLWIGLGAVFIGAVHDFAALVASVRHEGESVTEIVRAQLGRPAELAMMAFIWLSLIYVIVAFTDITARSFVGASFAKEGGEVVYQQGAAVAGASTLYLLLALAMGLCTHLGGMSVGRATLVFVPLTLVAILAGSWWPDLFLLPVAPGLTAEAADLARAKLWSIGILVYCFLGSLAPLWLLVQPRGHLGGMFLFLVLAIGALGILAGGFPVLQPAFKGFAPARPDGTVVPLFPTLFITIACGACSGFHGLVCSGTTSKQIAREGDCRPVGYGAMLGEAVVAVIALGTVLILAPGEAVGSPGTLYGNGIGRFTCVLIGAEHARFAATFGAMAFSTFVFDTLDVCTRLGRYMIQEVTGFQGPSAKYLATLATLLPAAALLLASDRTNAYMDYWALFGASNQLLAGLTLLAITVWLRRIGKPVWPTLGPTLVMVGLTLYALYGIGRQNLAKLSAGAAGVGAVAPAVNASVALLLAGLALFLVKQGLRAWGEGRTGATPAGT